MTGPVLHLDSHRRSAEVGGRLSFAALDAMLGWPGTRELALRLRVSRRTVQRWRRTGVSVFRADELAALVSLHPEQVSSGTSSSPPEPCGMHLARAAEVVRGGNVAALIDAGRALAAASEEQVS